MAIILGDENQNTLGSTNAGDEIFGLGGDDSLTAEHANVKLYGGDGIDVLASNESAVGATMDGGADGDILLGGSSNDTASYANDAAGVTVDLSTFSAIDGSGSFDLLLGIENVMGSAFDDSLSGDFGANVLQGGAGNDTLAGNGGADVFSYSFDFTPGGGGGETFRFTDFFQAHGGSVVDGEVADGTNQGQFSSLYTQWLESLGLTVSDLGQNAGPDGTPEVEGPAGTFGERESFTWTSGGGKKTVTHERWYSDTWTSGSGGGGQDSVSSADGFDTILDFNFGEDQLAFNGLAGMTLDQFTSLFTVTESDVNADTVMDTVLALADNSWGVELLGVSGHSESDFYNASLFS